MAEPTCNDEKERRWLSRARNIADEAVARCVGGQVDGHPTRRKPSIGNILTMLAMAAGLLASYGAVTADNTKRDLRIDANERRQIETRTEIKGEMREIRTDMKIIQQDVQRILGAVERIKGNLDARDRREGR